MQDHPFRTTRRTFFLRGGAVLGAGVATATSALSGVPSATVPADAADREALRALHAQFLRHIETADYRAATALFDTRACLELSGPALTGAQAIGEFFDTQYATGDAPLRHTAYRRGAAQPEDDIRVQGDLAQASFAAEAELCTPLAATCTVAQMARLQGNVAARTWQPGRFDVRYVRRIRGWRIADLRWSAA